MSNRKSVSVDIPEADKLAIVERFQDEGCPVSVAQSLMRLCCGESAQSIAESVDRSAGTIRRWKNEYKEPVSKVREVIALAVLSAPEFYDSIAARLKDSSDSGSRTGALSFKSVLELLFPRGHGPLIAIDQRTGQWGASGPGQTVTAPAELMALTSEQLNAQIKCLDEGGDSDALLKKHQAENAARDEAKADTQPVVLDAEVVEVEGIG